MVFPKSVENWVWCFGWEFVFELVDGCIGFYVREMLLQEREFASGGQGGVAELGGWVEKLTVGACDRVRLVPKVFVAVVVVVVVGGVFVLGSGVILGWG